MAFSKERASVSNELLFRLNHWPWIFISDQAAQLSQSTVVTFIRFFFYHLENKPSPISRNVGQVPVESLSCLWCTFVDFSHKHPPNFNQEIFALCWLLPKMLLHILERSINKQCTGLLYLFIFLDVWPWTMVVNTNGATWPPLNHCNANDHPFSNKQHTQRSNYLLFSLKRHTLLNYLHPFDST